MRDEFKNIWPNRRQRAAFLITTPLASEVLYLRYMSSAVVSYFQQFRSIPETDQDMIFSCFEPRAFKEGEFLFREGKVCSQLFYIRNGILRIVSTNDKGMDRTHYFYKEDQFCTILKSFEEASAADAGIQAACDVEVLTISKQKLNELYMSVPYIKDVIERMFQRQLLQKIEMRNAFVGADAETQYKLFVENQPDIALRVSLKDIASYLGITPQSLSRIRRNR
ncbi:MAG TPA: Crp/Fnr family transcriptional regulator [Puia sp.]|jgi:CRP-like cAMP-binding protein